MAQEPGSNEEGVVSVFISIEGTDLTDRISIISVKTDHGFGRIPEARVLLSSGSVADEKYQDADGNDFVVGNRVIIRAAYGAGKGQAIFEGVIARVRMKLDFCTGPQLEIGCLDPAYALARNRSSALYEGVTDSDIITKVIADAGLSGDAESTTGTNETLLRNECTDWDFIRLLADRNGHLVNVDDGTIAVAPPEKGSAVLTVTAGRSIIEFDTEVNTEYLIGKSSWSAWDSSAQNTISGEGSSHTETGWGNQSLDELAAAPSKSEETSYSVAGFDEARLQTTAEARLLRSDLTAMPGRCVFPGDAGVKTGDTIELSGLGKRYSGETLVTGVRHELGAGSWTTEAIFGLDNRWISEIKGGISSAAAGVNTPVFGTQVGIVQSVANDPGDALRIKVKLPLFDESGAEVWARFAQPYATAAGGIQFLPEAGDEVVVAFLGADPNAPVVIGSLHSEKRERALEAEEENYRKGIFTRENLNITFDDENLVITIETPGGQKITLDDDGELIDLTDQTGNRILMDPDGITITSPGDITLTADGDVSIGATGDSEVTGMNVDITADMGLTCSGASEAKLSADGNTTVKGAMVMIN